jgi:hypothetical protein
MAKLRQEMKDLIEKKKACFVAGGDKNGKTNVSPKGSLYGENQPFPKEGGIITASSLLSGQSWLVS